ncbi:MAG TPA: hypothetical protein VNJ01_18030 [Bacteriovoracaceae bacterium]|nr:hypothetical protein [Bacteriovoracaceae bacterium]
MNFTLVALLLFAVSCASMKSAKDHVQTPEYQQRPKITQSYYQTGEDSFSEAQVKTLLSQKLDLPGSLKIAVANLGHESKLTTILLQEVRSQQGVVVKDSMVAAFESIKGPMKRIKDLSVIPEILMPTAPDLKNLRDVAAIMQADLVLILKTRSITDSKFHLLKKNESKASATMEAILLDVRSGVIPFTSVATRSAHVKKEKDFSNEELYLRATLEAHGKALEEIVANVGSYLN